MPRTRRKLSARSPHAHRLLPLPETPYPQTALRLRRAPPTMIPRKQILKRPLPHTSPLACRPRQPASPVPTCRPAPPNNRQPAPAQPTDSRAAGGTPFPSAPPPTAPRFPRPRPENSPAFPRPSMPARRPHPNNVSRAPSTPRCPSPAPRPRTAPRSAPPTPLPRSPASRDPPLPLTPSHTRCQRDAHPAASRAAPHNSPADPESPDQPPNSS